MGLSYLLDTNVVIDYFGNKLPDNTSKILENDVSKISVITQIELLGWQNITVAELELMKEFVSSSQLYCINSDVISETIRIKQTYKLKTPDAIIAATAIVNDFILISRNESDFKKIVKLKFLNSFN